MSLNEVYTICPVSLSQEVTNHYMTGNFVCASKMFVTPQMSSGKPDQQVVKLHRFPHVTAIRPEQTYKPKDCAITGRMGISFHKTVIGHMCINTRRHPRQINVLSRKLGTSVTSMT